MSLDIFITGVGGQGSILASQVLAEAAIHAGMKALLGEIHGMAQRGGKVVSQVRIGEDVLSPMVVDGGADVLLGFEPLEAARALHKASPEKTVAVVSTRPIIPFTVAIGQGKYPDIDELMDLIRGRTRELIAFDPEELALQAGNRLTMSIVMVGALHGTGLLPYSYADLEETVRKLVPRKAVDVNLRALSLGRDKVRELREQA